MHFLIGLILLLIVIYLLRGLIGPRLTALVVGASATLMGLGIIGLVIYALVRH